MKPLRALSDLAGLSSGLPIFAPEAASIGHHRHWLFLDPQNDEARELKLFGLLEETSHAEHSDPDAVRVDFENGHYLVSQGTKARTSVIMSEGSVISGFPRFYSTPTWRIRLKRAFEWPNQREAVLQATCGRSVISFFDWNYALYKNQYQPENEYLFSLSVLAYSVTVDIIPKGPNHGSLGLDASERFLPFDPGLQKSRDEIRCRSIVEAVETFSFEGIHFQICDVTLADAGYPLKTQLFVPATVLSHKLKPGNQITFNGWLSGRVV